MKRYLWLLAFGYWLSFSILRAEAGPVEILNVSASKEAVGIYEKFELTVDISANYKNPYDPDDIELSAEFVSPKGRAYKIAGFYYEGYARSLGNGGGKEVLERIGEPAWKVRFTPAEQGLWKYVVGLKTQDGSFKTGALTFKCNPSSKRGFIRPSKKSANYFAFDDGTIYIPIGENLCWYATPKKTYDYDTWCALLAENGTNFIRLWLAPWAFAPEWKHTGLARYDQQRGYELDYIFELCEELGLYSMLCISNHGQFSRSNDPKWNENPYNVANGGPCRDPKDFLTNEAAKKFFKMRLRYIASRWGYSRNLMAWEWFNESDLSDLDNKDLVPWIEEMSKVLKEYDPYEHMISTSFHHLVPEEIWARPDISFTQLHKYNVRDFSAEFNDNLTAGYVEKYKKPFLIGEFGWIQDIVRTFDPKGIHLHDGIWSSVLSGSAGTAMIWYWDEYIHPNNLYSHFGALAKYLNNENWQGRKFRELDFIVENTDRLIVSGMQDKESAYIWLKNKDANLDEYIAYLMEKAKNRIRRQRGAREREAAFPPTVIEGATIAIDNLSNGWYTIFWYDTYSGDIIKAEKKKAREKRLELVIPEVSRDIAAKVIREGWWENMRDSWRQVLGGK